MSSRVERDIGLARRLGVRSIFYNEHAVVADYESLAHTKPELQVICHEHFESVLKQIDADTEYLDAKQAEHEGQQFEYTEYISELPSQNLINVGVAVVYISNK